MTLCGVASPVVPYTIVSIMIFKDKNISTTAIQVNVFVIIFIQGIYHKLYYTISLFPSFFRYP